MKSRRAIRKNKGGGGAEIGFDSGVRAIPSIPPGPMGAGGARDLAACAAGSLPRARSVFPAPWTSNSFYIRVSFRIF